MRHVLVVASFCSCIFVCGNLDADILLEITGQVFTDDIDVLELNGATLTNEFVIDDSGNYLDAFGFAAAPVTSGFVTISGSTLPANNGTYAQPAFAILPNFGGGGLGSPLELQSFTLPSGGSSFEHFLTFMSSPGSSNAMIGTPIELDDFTPVTFVGEKVTDLLMQLPSGSSFTPYSYFNVTITATMSGSMPGDVNQDGLVNLLDVAPFVELLSSGGFQVEADINGDGVVNLLDVSPFVDLLAG